MHRHIGDGIGAEPQDGQFAMKASARTFCTLIAMAWSLPAEAAYIVVGFDDFLSDIETGPDLPALTVAGAFAFDTSAQDSDPTKGIARFEDPGFFAGILNGNPFFAPEIVIKTGIQFETTEFLIPFNSELNLTRLEFITSGWDLVPGDGGFETLPTSLDVADLSSALVVINFRRVVDGSLVTVFSSVSKENVTTFSIPEPSALSLFTIGILGIGLARRRRTQ